MPIIRANPLGGTTRGTTSTDIILGSDVDDTIFADAGDDLVAAGRGNDKIFAGAGADHIDGGEGEDTLYFLDAAPVSGNHGVRVDLWHGTGSLGDSDGDTYANIENVVGSRYNDSIRGDSGRNTLFGDDGNDVIAGGAGGDKLDGGKGNDTLSYRYYATYDGAAPPQSAGVYVNLQTNVASGGDAQGDTIFGFENVDGSAGNDTLIGTNERNVIFGAEMDDKLYGQAGHDDLQGGEGNDTIDGGRDNDLIIGGDGNDVMKGGHGADLFVFNIVDFPLVGHDRIVDFEVGVDRIGWNVNYGTPQQNLAELNISHTGADTIITYDDVPGSLTLVGVGKEDMAALINSFDFY